MLRFIMLLMGVIASTTPSANPTTAHSRAVNERMLGRWDISIATPDGEKPSWLEVEESGRDQLVGRFVGVVGSARPISVIAVNGDSLSFAIPYQWEDGNGNLSVRGAVHGNDLSGTMTFPDGKTYSWTAMRAPRLDGRATPAWGTPVRLLHANDLGGWHPSGTTNQWKVVNGVLSSPKSGSNLITDRKFGDFKLHVEFRYPKESNSGVYLRGRHEVQIQDDFGNPPANDRFSGVYGFISPSVIAARPAGEWQTYDITLIGRMVTVVANGKQVICNQEIPGITGGALDSHEGEPGPLFLQGDHGPVDYRNIVITPAR